MQSIDQEKLSIKKNTHTLLLMKKLIIALVVVAVFAGIVLILKNNKAMRPSLSVTTPLSSARKT